MTAPEDRSKSRSVRPSQCICGRFPDPHERQRLCGIGFNEFLGEVQHRLLKAGYNPPIWPEPSIRDQGDVDAALDSCVQWCAARLVEASAVSERGDTVAVPRERLQECIAALYRKDNTDSHSLARELEALK